MPGPVPRRAGGYAVSGPPFGFRPEGDDDGEEGKGEGLPARGEQPGQPGQPGQPPGQSAHGPGGGPGDPFSALLAGLGGAGFGAAGGASGPGAAGAPDIGAMLQHLGRLLSWSGGPVNWDLARDAARQVVQAAGDRSVGEADRRAVTDAFRLADLWLEEATAFPAAPGAARAWSRAEWVEETMPGWRALVEPVAARVAEAMTRIVPAEMAQAVGPFLQMFQQIGVSMWGAQVGQGVGRLATEVVGTTDVGLTLVPDGRPALLPANVRSFGEGLGLDERDVTVYLALREAAHLRLFAHAPWLRPHLVSLVEEYARHVQVDTDSIESSIRGLDPQRPEAIQEAIEGGLFDLPTTPAQEAALGRLETALALVEGWVDDVVTTATQGRLPSAPALRETVRRRRATGGPAEQTFATLVGLQLRPRRLREAAAFWTVVRERIGVSARDGLWAHPDLMPSGEDLADAEAFLASRTHLDLGGLDGGGPDRERPPDGPPADPPQA